MKVSIEILQEMILDHVNESWHDEINSLFEDYRRLKSLAHVEETQIQSWKASPDRTGCQYTAEEILKHANGRERC